MKFCMVRLSSSILAAVSMAIVSLLAVGSTHAQNYPSKPIRLLVGTAAGGPVDLPSRWVAFKLSEVLGKPVVLDFRGGAAGEVANETVAKAAPDGYTLLWITNSFVLASVNPTGRNYDPIKDFSPIGLVTSTQTLLLARTTLGVNSVKELIAYAKKNPGKLTFGSNGTGGTQHLYGEMLKSMAGIDMLHVPFKGGNLSLNELVAGRLDLLFFSMAGALPQVKTGKVVALGGAARERSKFLPDLPSLHEQGVTGFDGGGRNGIVAPAKTPPAVIRKLNDALVKVLAMPETTKTFNDAGLEATPTTPAEFEVWIKTQSARFRQVINAAGIELQ
jgi:tripartite-type tricarboxylate transporter receptor subunit TctC